MKLEKLNDIVANRLPIRSGDYLYQHDKETDVPPNEINGLKLYYVGEISENILKIHGVLSEDEKSIKINEPNGFWWVRRLHPMERKLLGMEM